MSKRKKRSLGEENRAGLLFVSPWIVSFLVFSVYPIVMSAYYSFTDFSAIKKPKWIGLANYTALFHDALFFKSLYNTLFFVFVSIPLSLILALTIALLLNIKIKGRALFRSIFFLPSVLPQVAATMIWIWILNPMTGYLNRFLRLFGVKTIHWARRSRLYPLVGDHHRLWSIGTMIVIFLAAIQDIPADLYEAADIDGRAAAQAHLHHHPLDLPCPALPIILAIINGFQYFTQVYVVITAQAGHSGAGGKRRSKGHADDVPALPLLQRILLLEDGESERHGVDPLFNRRLHDLGAAEDQQELGGSAVRRRMR